MATSYTSYTRCIFNILWNCQAIFETSKWPGEIRITNYSIPKDGVVIRPVYICLVNYFLNMYQ